MKLAITADFHYGISNDSAQFLTIGTEFVNKLLLPTLQRADVMGLAILGDIFNNRKSTSCRTLNVAMDIMERLVAVGKPIWAILGNHDIYYNRTKDVHMFKIFDQFPDTFCYYTTPTVEIIAGQSVLFAPWLHKEDIVDFVAMVKKRPDICLGHLEIIGFDLVRGFINNRGLSQKFMESHVQRTFSGHFHLRSTKGNITYTGCPYPLTWNDYRNSKGIYLLDMDTLQTTFIENVISPQYVMLSMQEIEDSSFAQLADRVHNNFVKINITNNMSQKTITDAILTVESHDPLSCTTAFIADISDEQTAELETKMENVVGLSPIDFLSAYLDQIGVPEGLDKSLLLGKVFEIERNVRQEQ